MSPDAFADLFRYNDWANGRFFDAFSGLDADDWTKRIGGSFGSLQHTAAHVVGAEWVWLERLAGRAPTAAPEWLAAPTVARLRDVLSRVEEERRAWLATLGPSDLDCEIDYRLFDGTESSSRLSVLLLHVVDHSSYHRGQFVMLLRLLDRTPPTTGLLTWERVARGGS